MKISVETSAVDEKNSKKRTLFGLEELYFTHMGRRNPWFNLDN